MRTPLRVPLPSGTAPGRYRLEVGWYHFVEGQPIWRPWAAGNRLTLGEVEVAAPADWWTLPLPSVAQPIGVTMGEGVRLLGFDASSVEGQPGDTLHIDLFWQATDDRPEPGMAVLQLASDGGEVRTEISPAAVGSGLKSGQTLRDLRSLTLPGTLPPGVYNLSLGRRRPDGTWLPVRRGPFPLGSIYPLATVRVLGRPLNLVPPTVQQPTDARFGEGIRLVGYDLEPQRSNLELTLHWQSLAPTATRYKIFVHLVGGGGSADIRAQVDVYPHLSTTGWLPGEYLSDRVTLDLPADLAPGHYTLLVGLYDEATGSRLPVFDAAGQASGDSLVLEQVRLGQ